MATLSKASTKPAKPYLDFPLFPRATRRWAKKIRGKLHYFGPWKDPDGAIKRRLDQRDDLHAGRTPRVQRDGLAIRDLANHFLTAKKHQLETAEITQHTFNDYHATCKRIIDIFGKTRLVVDLAAVDFIKLRAELAKTRGLVALGNEVQRIHTVFKYAYDAGLTEKPMRFGPAFRRPSKKALRKARQELGPRMFESEENKTIMMAADQPLRAMIHLGINCGFGNNDVATLPIKAIDMETRWVTHSRPKTGAKRRVRLWPETSASLRTALACRPNPKDEAHAEFFFITKYGQPSCKKTSDNPISKEMAKLLKKLGIHRPGLNFYALRHSFETIAGETRDQVAVDHIMGHARDDMASVYRERISDERLVAVTEFVRRWLFGADG